MLFDDPKLIFLHVPKTGGGTLTMILNHSIRKGKTVEEKYLKFNNHDTLQMYQDAGVDLSQYEIFTVARNPWDRVLSYYCHHYRKDNGFIFPRTLPLMFGNGGVTYVSFPDFYNNTSSKDRFLEDFMDFITIDGKIVDNLTILDFENLEEDVSKFFEKFNFPKLHFPHKNNNRLIPKEFRDYFLYDPAFIEKISVEYSKEIEYFGYEAPQLKYTPVEIKEAERQSK